MHSTKIFNNDTINQSTTSALHLALAKTDEDARLSQPMHHLIGIYGGTFDPPHIMHFQLMLAALSHLNLEQIRIIPCHIPAHGKTPIASATDRLKMVELASASHPKLHIDTCEYERDTPSKTIDTLKILHKRFPDASLCLIIGMDNLINFTTWHQWEEILTLTHLVVANRPGYSLPKEGPIAELLKKRLIDNKRLLQTSQAGSVLFFDAPQLEISSTAIRDAFASGKASKFIPSQVQTYINEHHLYIPPAQDILPHLVAKL